MKIFRLGAYIALLACISASSLSAEPFYQLRTYKAEPGGADKIRARIRDHTVPHYAKYGIQTMGFWTSYPATRDGSDVVYYLIHHPDYEQGRAALTAAGSDRSAGELPRLPIRHAQSWRQIPTRYSNPKAQSPDAQHSGQVVEMRLYTVVEGQMSDLNAHFRRNASRLFAKHGMDVLGFFHPSTEEEKVLMCLIAHKSVDAVTVSHAALESDPEWQKMDTKPGGAIVARLESSLLQPVEIPPVTVERTAKRK